MLFFGGGNWITTLDLTLKKKKKVKNYNLPSESKLTVLCEYLISVTLVLFNHKIQVIAYLCDNLTEMMPSKRSKNINLMSECTEKCW